MTEQIVTPDRKGLRKAALETGIAIALLFGVLLPWLLNVKWPRWPWFVGGVIVLLGVFAPASLGPAYRVWMRFAALLHKITSPLILGIMFFLIVWPFGIVMRLSGRDPMRSKAGASEKSYRVPSEPIRSDNLRRPF